jgi:hypothetical protein
MKQKSGLGILKNPVVLYFGLSFIPSIVVNLGTGHLKKEETPGQSVVFFSREARAYERVNILIKLLTPNPESFGIGLGYIKSSGIPKEKDVLFDQIDNQSRVILEDKSQKLESQEASIIENSNTSFNYQENDFISFYIDKLNNKIVFENLSTGRKHEIRLARWEEFVPIIVMGANTQIRVLPIDHILE